MMHTQSLLNQVAAYNSWANESLVNWAATHSAEELAEELPNGQGSILKMLNHIWSVEEFWLKVIQGQDAFSGERYTATVFKAEEIFPGLVAGSKQLQAYVQGCDEAELAEVLRVDFPWVKGADTRYNLIQHIFNHGTYHRGQLTSMARRLGWTGAPMTDYNYFNLAVLAPQV